MPLIATSALIVLVYITTHIIYRLYFHPLSKFPGPTLAAISYLPEIYYDVLKGGMYIWEIERMHDKYGTCSKYLHRQRPTVIIKSFQEQLFELIHERSISKIPLFTMKYIQVENVFDIKIRLLPSHF